MGIEIGHQERCLEEDEAGDPDGGRPAKYGQELLGGHGLDEKKKERGKKDCAAKKDS
jgi:hypothetical protein